MAGVLAPVVAEFGTRSEGSLMPRSILVPVDGSSLSEAALNVAIPLARRHGAELETITVFEPPLAPGQTSGAPVPERRLEGEERAATAAYVENIGHRLESMATGLTTRSTFREGVIAEQIIALVKEREHDLVVITTHGRSGVSRLWLGSVADRLLRTCPVPVLLLTDLSSTRPSDEATPFRNVVIPLDGSDESESVLADAVAVAGESAAYHLIHVVAAMTLMPPSPIGMISIPRGEGRPSADTLGAANEAAIAYLDRLAQRLLRRGLQVRTRVQVHGSPAEAILAYASDLPAPLVAMTSHGRGRAGRLFLGSVADKLVRGTTMPVLVRVGGVRPLGRTRRRVEPAMASR
jgi:nucleotide-binding universal stress UspA family protein